MVTTATPDISKDYTSSEEAMKEVLLELCRHFKGIDSEIDARIDAAAAYIANDDRVSIIAPHNINSPKVPIYLEGAPGEGKSSLIEAAAREFCRIAGLNFVSEPPENYQFQKYDFYYCKVNLSGAQNKSDFGGMMIRTEMDAMNFIKARRKLEGVGSHLLDELISRSKGIESFAKTVGVKVAVNTCNYALGPLEAVEVDVECPDLTHSYAIAESLIQQLSEKSKSEGFGLTKLNADGEPADDRVSCKIESVGTGKTKVTLFTPAQLEEKAEYASALLPSLRFAKFKKTQFGLVNFDDVANANENIRNILLEVIQTGRYSGTMDIGNAYVTLSGNMGAEDNTNVFSRMSDAELTRLRKLNVRDNPQDWAARILKKYNSEVGDCHMSAFIHRCGTQEGIFSEPPKARSQRGVAKTNGRALENALEVIYQHFAAAKAAGISPLQFKDRITKDFAACAGKRAANAYQEFMVQMETEAIPLAEALITKGIFDESKFEKHSQNALSAGGIDFVFRFAAALSDSFIAYNNELPAKSSQKEIADRLTLSMERMSTGLAAMANIGQSSSMNYALTRLVQKLSNQPKFIVADQIKPKLNTKTIDALANGFVKSINNDVWGSPEDIERAKENFTTTISGAKISAARSPSPGI